VVKAELAESLPKKSCCRKSMLCGVLIDAAETEKADRMSALFSPDLRRESRRNCLKSIFRRRRRRRIFPRGKALFFGRIRASAPAENFAEPQQRKRG
jgi:hypothetical protein